MLTPNALLRPSVLELCARLTNEFDAIDPERAGRLRILGRYVAERRAAGHPARLLAVCTHNSRRSHLAQLWLATGADFYGLEGVETFSGGTEATAVNPRLVGALRRAGFGVAAPAPGKNPVYHVAWRTDGSSYPAFSKRLAAPPNPTADFAALMVCSAAAADCPIVPGCDLRVAVPYADPKVADDLPEEAETYDRRLREIGRDMLYALSVAAGGKQAF